MADYVWNQLRYQRHQKYWIFFHFVIRICYNKLKTCSNRWQIKLQTNSNAEGTKSTKSSSSLSSSFIVFLHWLYLICRTIRVTAANLHIGTTFSDRQYMHARLTVRLEKKGYRRESSPNSITQLPINGSVHGQL